MGPHKMTDYSVVDKSWRGRVVDCGLMASVVALFLVVEKRERGSNVFCGYFIESHHQYGMTV